MSEQGFLIIDVGSTTTKALLIERQGEAFRLTHRAEAGTTVEAPYEDVMVGVMRSVQEIERLSNRSLLAVNNEGEVKPANLQQFLVTSSAGGGLQILVCGLAKRVTAESAERAALGAGAILLDVLSPDDGRSTYQRLESIRQARPDMILLAGGIEGGDKIDFVLNFCDLLNSAKPAPRFGQTYSLPVIYAGTSNAVALVEDTLQRDFELHTVPNLRPSFEQENLGPARQAIHELFLEHVMAQAPGYSRLKACVTGDIMPTPLAVGKIMTLLAERDGKDILGVDIGGATTDIFSVIRGAFYRTVSANLGMSYSAGNVLINAGADNVRRWLPYEISNQELADEIATKMLHPTTVPATLRDLQIEQALAREALRLSLVQHADLVVDLPAEKTMASSALSEQMDNVRLVAERTSLLDMERVGMIIGSGGVLSHAPRRPQAAAMLLDAFQPKGETYLAVDSIFMMPHLGVLSEREPDIALEVLLNDCFVPLGPSFSLFGQGREGLALRYTLKSEAGVVQGECKLGEIRVLPLTAEQEAELTLEPQGSFDIGAGGGRTLSKRVSGGAVGVILDCRGRDMAKAEEQTLRNDVAKGLLALGAFTEEEINQAAKGGDS